MSIKGNNAFQVSARKYRPQEFESVVGQDHITSTLLNAIRTNRVHQAYLFCGPRGVGKTTTARIFAKALNCINPINYEPCNECISCVSILNGQSMDVIEIDGASNNSVDDVRKLRDSAKYPPSSGRYKLYIIDEVHMLSTSAFNALLKTLEEPPPHLVFIFATTESHKVPATIISRCQRFDFRRMELDIIIHQLSEIAEAEGITIDEEALRLIAIKGDGSMRDSQSIFDQARAFCGNNIDYKGLARALNLIDEDFYFRISNAIAEADSAELFKVTSQLSEGGYDVGECLKGLTEHFRHLTYSKILNTSPVGQFSMNTRKKLEDTALKFDQKRLLAILKILIDNEKDIRFASQAMIRFEATLLTLAQVPVINEISQLIAEIQNVKKKVLN